MILEAKFEPPVKAASIELASDGSVARVWSEPDDDGLRRYQRYDREGDTMVLRRSATYRLDADGKTWTQTGAEIIYRP